MVIHNELDGYCNHIQSNTDKLYNIDNIVSINPTFYRKYFDNNDELNEYFFYHMNEFISDVINDNNINFYFGKVLKNDLGLEYYSVDENKTIIGLVINYKENKRKFFTFKASPSQKSKFIHHKNNSYVVYDTIVKDSKIIFENEYRELYNIKD